ncbi:protein-glutamate methylesterase/protein-glutamine glutaminase [Halorhodospira halophila]|uniref:Protein-glutamate methylesterase/protein-glutamine glutaminase n=1 Tax=Halorhodospira halophila (strain DSM 244 / SL1) TaxID=349124 RepID=A1WZ12_HALHL|nr:chemotaxis response regulator protein-glutamate methylesterase [Halorhodospira halophila]ABM62924.1 response regulator receiver modulated CheB methylesterase [Halorhodospira halophila SL1]MBK1727955.1 chemotaxis response regulator protein-glutamate methylesterase [Halorhodospira halophila]
MIRVLIVDDSALIRRLLAELFAAEEGIEVVGTARDPYDAREKIKQLNPDVLTLDVEMPRMDGITFLRNLMRLRPMPVVMVSSLTEVGAEETLEALALGAVDFVTKPKADVSYALEGYRDEIVAKVRAAAQARVRPGPARSAAAAPPRPHQRTTDKVVAIGASTGGTVAVQRLLEVMPPNAPATVITQHMPPGFSAAFAQRLDHLCAVSVHEAQDGQRVLPGHVYIAPGGYHLELHRDGSKYICRVTEGELVNRHRPSVDVLFNSVATSARANAVGVLLTGMGSDGAVGLGRMQAAGAVTIAQDEASSVVWGMPGAAVKAGHADQVLPLERIAEAIQAAVAPPSQPTQER